MSASVSTAPISDSFLDAKAQSSRRATSYDMSSSSSNGSSFIRRGSSALAVVPENHDHHPATSTSQPQVPPPSAYNGQQSGSTSRKSTRRTVSDTSNAHSAGSLREMDKALEMKMRRTSPEKGKSKELPLSSQVERRRKADWVIDLVETSQGAVTWSEDQRVILVLGDPTPASLAPILYDPAFSDTLLLVGSYRPLPAIEALLSPSHLMSSSPNQQIFPTVQPFNTSVESNDTDAHALTVLLAQATSLAQQYRSRPRGSSTFTRPRAGSVTSSSASNSPPSTPPMRKRVLSNFNISGSSSARSSTDSTLSTNERQRSASMYDTSNESTPKAKNRLTSFGRDSIFGGLMKSSDGSDFGGSPSAGGSGQHGSLFDAVINFVPDMKNFKPERALQDMLHQAVVITTGIMPSLTRQRGKPPSNPQMPISLIHVLPKIMPTPLPNVIESFLLSLLPTFQLRCPREIFGCVVTTPVWLSPFVESRPAHAASSTNSRPASQIAAGDVSGAEVLLFGGVRCPYQVLGSNEEFRPRAFLANWSSCMSMPGLIAESRRPSTTSVTSASTSASSRPSSSGRPSIGHERQLSSPPSIPYTSTHARTPPHSRSPSPPKNPPLPLSSTGRASGPSSLPRSMSMPMPNTMSTSTSTTASTGVGRSKLHVSHTPPMSSEIDLPQTSPTQSSAKNLANGNGGSGNSPPTPDLDPSVNSSSRASSFALGETTSGRGSEHGGENVKIVNGSEPLSTVGSANGRNASSVSSRKGLKGWFKRK
ncbi:uncharacterized protein I303_106438 [Kwoniella dejecticola CBS 10117]|uniref:Uncharacterized protein n=1 Tax=Kwoniella dejecticola CBS 10117 TaxID=1296121 RepID=A0A1A5ZUP8_9TREE|nr:uncharacterized protein I303_08302 [Kwoniella dejecticola CBS 10117]OBR81532.1 hypothetical protein I303_08302 [Kwoniella dejecticola CBS 10117]